MNIRLQYLADSILIEALAKDDPMRRFAQSSIMEDIGSGITQYVKSQWDPKQPIESVAAFFAPGLLWSLGFPWMSVFYEVAEAFGFNWKGFWGDVGGKMQEFVHGVASSGQPPSEQEVSTAADGAVNAAMQQHASGESNMGKLWDMAKKYIGIGGDSNPAIGSKISFDQNLRNVILLKALVIKSGDSKTFLKNAELLKVASLTGKLFGFFVRVLRWLAAKALLSLGITLAGGLLWTALGKPALPNGAGATPASYQASGDILQPAANTPAAMFQVHDNDMSASWVEHYSISEVEEMLSNWVRAAYPQLDINEVKSSSGFAAMVNKFKQRNSMGQTLSTLIVPLGYERRIDVAGLIATQFIKEHPQPTEPPKEPLGPISKNPITNVDFK
jgi:hypothetical protein